MPVFDTRRRSAFLSQTAQPHTHRAAEQRSTRLCAVPPHPARGAGDNDSLATLVRHVLGGPEVLLARVLCCGHSGDGSHSRVRRAPARCLQALRRGQRSRRGADDCLAAKTCVALADRARGQRAQAHKHAWLLG